MWERVQQKAFNSTELGFDKPIYSQVSLCPKLENLVYPGQIFLQKKLKSSVKSLKNNI